MDSGRFQIRAYMHRQELYNQKKQGWSAAGPYKLYILQCYFLEMVLGVMSRKKNLFHDKPTTTVDNYFVTDSVIDWYGNACIGIIGKNARNRLPEDIEHFYLHKEKTNVTMKNTNSARLFDPLVVVRNYSRGFQHVHVSFQSNPYCNIEYSNALNECINFV